jgi:hypothetical protein
MGNFEWSWKIYITALCTNTMGCETYVCGTDFSEEASNIVLSKPYYRPYMATYEKNLKLSCMHTIDEKIYKLDKHVKTCHVCGEDSDNPIVENHFPVCSLVWNEFNVLYD